MKTFPVVFALILSIAQFTLTAQDAWIPGIEFQIIRSERVDVIFPRELEDEAVRAARLLDYSIEELARNLGVEKIRRWKLILSFGNSFPNGYVASGPAYSLWYQGNGGDSLSQGDWFTLMASHEGRHMMQNERLKQGFGKVLYWLFGDGGPGYLKVAVFPRWLFEGDAVLSETLLTSTGRGRNSDFALGVKAHALASDMTYSKMVNGSYRMIYPGLYEYGYFLTTYIRKNYGEEALDKIFSLGSAVPLPVLGMSLGIRAATGKGPSALFREMQDELSVLYEEQLEEVVETDAEYIHSPGKGEYFQFSNPGILPSGEIVAVKSDFDDRRRIFFYSPSGQIMRSIPYDHYMGDGISVAGSRMGFCGISRDPRWPALEYRDIFVKDLQGGEEFRLTSKSRFLTPALSPDGTRVAGVEILSDGNEKLVVIDSLSGERLSELPIPPGGTPGAPTWDSDGRNLALTLQNCDGMSLIMIDSETGEWRELTGFSFSSLADPVFWKEWVLFSTDQDGIRNIYAVHVEDKNVFRLTSRKYGASRPAVTGETLYFIDAVGIEGEALARMPLIPSEWEAAEPVRSLRMDYFQEIIEQEDFFSEQGSPFFDPEKIPETEYEVDDYRPVGSLINIHSWGLAPGQLLADDPEIRMGFFSRDILDTTSLNGWGSYNINEKTFGSGLYLQSRVLYPVISLEGVVLNRNLDGREWTETGVAAELSLPLDFSLGLIKRSLLLSMGVQFYKYQGIIEKEGGTFIDGEILWRNYLAGGFRRIFPRWSWTLGIEGILNPAESGDFLFFGHTIFNIPGILKNHSTTVSSGYEIRQGTRASRLQFIRGYSPVAGKDSVNLSVDYDFPVFYPDIPLGVAFLKRLRGNLFVQGFRRDGEVYTSAGGALFLDFIPLNLFFMELNIGVRSSYRFNDRAVRWELIFMNGAIQ